MEKYKLHDGVVSLTTRKVAADRKVELRTFTKTQTPRTESTVTYEPHGSSGSGLDVNTLVYEMMIIAGYDMLQVGHATYGGDYTAAELAGKVGYLPMFMENDSESWDHTHIHIKTKTFDCSFDAGEMFETMAEWEGVAGITAKNAYKFRCEGREVPRGAVVKPYRRCHGYKPTTFSMAMEERRINQKFEVLGKLYQRLTSEGMRKALSVIAAVRCFDNMSYEWRGIAKQAMLWKLWKDYARETCSMPVEFSASDFNGGPACYQVVDDEYAASLVSHFRRIVADAPKPEWPVRGDVVTIKGAETMKRKYCGKKLVDSVLPRLAPYGNRIDWVVAVSVGKFDVEYFLPGQLEPAADKAKKAKKTKAAKPKAAEPDGMTMAEQLRQALLAMAA